MWRYRDDYKELPSLIEPVRKRINHGFSKLSDAQREKGKRVFREKYSKPVLQFDFDGKFIKEYPSLKAAAEDLNGDSATITNACQQNKSKTAYGYQWRYKEVVNDPSDGIKPLKYASGGAKKPILQYTEDDEFIREWDSLKAATEFYKVSKGCLSAALSNKRKLAIGFIWRYK